MDRKYEYQKSESRWQSLRQRNKKRMIIILSGVIYIAINAAIIAYHMIVRGI